MHVALLFTYINLRIVINLEILITDGETDGLTHVSVY